MKGPKNVPEVNFEKLAPMVRAIVALTVDGGEGRGKQRSQFV